MGHKIFISYKYADDNVKHLGNDISNNTTVRDYVNVLQDYIKNFSDNIFKAESDDEDLSGLSKETIWGKLKDRIFDSSLTIVVISPNMRNLLLTDKDQWIPWEISYSLKEPSRKDKNGTSVTSKSNAILAVVLPDKSGNYNYFIRDNICCQTTCRTLQTSMLFDILKNNMFNAINPNKTTCSNNSVIFHGESSYILSVKWIDFISTPEKYINRAYNIRDTIDNYNIQKEL